MWIFVIILMVVIFFSLVQQISKVDSSEDISLYKSKGIKSFDLKGMYYNNLDKKKHTGDFLGYAICEYNQHDMYAVAIYDSNNQLLGYVPKHNKRLSNSISQWHNEKVFAWGSLKYFNTYQGGWYGTVNIPVGFTEIQLNKLQDIFSLISENTITINQNDKSTKTYFKILYKHKRIKALISELNNPKEIEYNLQKN